MTSVRGGEMNYSNYELIIENSFNKTKDKYKASGRYRLIKKIDRTIENLLNNTLTTDMHPHTITGSKSGDWEYHVERNVLIRYKFDHKEKVLILKELGTHDEVLRSSYNPDDNIDDLMYLLY